MSNLIKTRSFSKIHTSLCEDLANPSLEVILASVPDYCIVFWNINRQFLKEIKKATGSAIEGILLFCMDFLELGPNFPSKW